MKIIDTHCHLNIEPYIKNLDEYREILNSNKIILNVVGTNINDSLEAIALANKYGNIFATVGIHPNEVKNHNESDFHKLEDMVIKNRNKIIAIGETGFDYYYENYDKKLQLKFLESHFNLALKYDLVLVLHIRDAHDDAIKFLKSKDRLPRTIIHCFTGTYENMKEYTNLGCYISFSGIITFKNCGVLKEVVRHVPNHLILSETDSPFLTPVPYRGKTNNPLYVKYVNEEIARLKEINLYELNNLLLENAKNCFKKF